MKVDLTIDSAIDSAVAQKDRISIDVSDLREEIETCRNDAAWAELPLSAKIRVLIKERLEQMKAQSNAPAIQSASTKAKPG